MNKINIGDDLYLKGRIGWRGLSKDEYLKSGNYRIINATSLEDKHINWEKCGYITEDRYNESPEIQLKEKDILISKDGTLGKIGYVRNLEHPSTVASGIFVLRNTKKDLIDTDFLFHYLKSEIFKNFIVRMKASGSTINHLYQRDLAQLEIDLPDIETQKKIANILNLIDSKIELNDSFIGLLEANLNTIYQYWFLQYDFPNVRSKPYRSSGGEMIKAEGYDYNIPADWKVRKLGDVISRTGTGLNPRDNFILGEGNNYYITIKNVKDGRIIFDEKCDRITDEAMSIIQKRSDLRKGDVLFTSIQPVGVTYYVSDTPANWNINESVFTIRANNEYITPEYLFLLLSSAEMKQYTENSSAGSVHKGIRHSTLKEFIIPIGSKHIYEKFSFLAEPVVNKINNIDSDSNALDELRKMILPLLMTGQIKVA